jgi:cytochrome c nitrite reductase small subunit
MGMRTMLLLAAAALMGIAAGIGSYTFVYAKGYSYLTNDPAACANCHVMQPQYDGWRVSPHRSVAVCNDCHTPPGLIPKYATKALNGFNHSYAFTTGRFPEPILITERNRRVTEKACRKCHAALTVAIEGPHRPGQEMACLRCHSDVGHP